MIADMLPDLSTAVVRGLAVLGGALLGALLSGMTAKVGARMMWRRQVPPLALKGVRGLGAVALGLAVYLFVFGPGGGGFGLGGPGWFGSGGTGANSSPTTPAPTVTAPQTTEPATEPREVLRIEMLGGKQYPGGERFYRVEGVTEALTLDEVRQHIGSTPQLKVVEIVIRSDSVAEGHKAVLELKQMARDRGKTVRVSHPSGEGP